MAKQVLGHCLQAYSFILFNQWSDW